jgi:hypothetical protein
LKLPFKQAVQQHTATTKKANRNTFEILRMVSINCG